MLIDLSRLPDLKMFTNAELRAFYIGKVKQLQPPLLVFLRASVYRQEHSQQYTTGKLDNLLEHRRAMVKLADHKLRT